MRTQFFLALAAVSPFAMANFWCDGNDSEGICPLGQSMVPINSYACGLISDAKRLSQITPVQGTETCDQCPGDSSAASNCPHPPGGSVANNAGAGSGNNDHNDSNDNNNGGGGGGAPPPSSNTTSAANPPPSNSPSPGTSSGSSGDRSGSSLKQAGGTQTTGDEVTLTCHKKSATSGKTTFICTEEQAPLSSSKKRSYKYTEFRA